MVFSNALRSRGRGEKAGIALIIGAGGTARAAAYVFDAKQRAYMPAIDRSLSLSDCRYAARQLDLGVLVWNPSLEKAKSVADDFQGLPVATIQDAVRVAEGQATELAAVISTVPTAAGVLLPESVLALQPTVLEASYMPQGQPPTVKRPLSFD